MVLCLFGIQQVTPRNEVEWLARRKGWFGQHQNAAAWNTSPFISCGVSGGKETFEASKGMRNQFWT
jgi:hypothetical protein